jgi:pimeloyl-ACP methyl ester carboxylesterase
LSTASEPEQHFFRSQRLKLCYWSWGDPTNPPVILQHGGRDHGRSWDRIAEALADEYYVVTPDLRGHGDSDWEIGGEYSTPQAVVDLMALIDEIGAPVNIVAHSYGGLLTYLAAGSYPDRFRAIVSIEGRISGRPTEPEPLNPQTLRKTIEARRDLERRMPHRYATLDDAAERMHESNRRLHPEMAHHLALHGVRDAGDADGGLVWKFDNWARPGVRRDDVSPNEGQSFAEAIECPVLLIVGDQSGGLRNQQDEIKYFRDGRAVLVADAAHWVHHDQPAAVIDEARTFLAAVAARA